MSLSRSVAVRFHVVALCAVALFGYAHVRSVVMQAAMVTAETCDGAMAGMSMSEQAGGHVSKGKAAHRSCAFCAAAAHAPLSASAPVLPAPAAVAWSPHLAWRSHGPRGPPAFRAQARGPPASLLI